MSNLVRLGVFKFASCDGCQLSLLNAEDELMCLAEQVEIVYFPEASSLKGPGPFDVALVEGSISTPEDHTRIQRIRRLSKTLITIGACATAGGIQALRNGADRAEFLRIVYPHPEFLRSLARTTPISDHVTVDFELRGCPVNKDQLLQVLGAVIHNRALRVPNHSVCRECKLNGTVCLMVARGIPCLGPVTQAGCGGLCPEFARGCYGCFGPSRFPNTASLLDRLQADGHEADRLVPLLRNFNCGAPEFAEAAAHVSGNVRQ